MTKHIVLFLSLTIVIACQKSPTTTYNSDSYDATFFAVSSDILSAIDDFWADINPPTKSTQTRPDIASIVPISTPLVKSNQPEFSPSYLINFTNNSGFSIVAIEDSGSPSVLALTESGTIDGDKLFNKEAEYNFDEERILYCYIEDMLAAFHSTQNKVNHPTKALGSSTWYTDTIAYPIVHVKWGQAYPFNMSMPTVPDTLTSFGPSSPYRGRYAVGCTIIAAMQIAIATEHPYGFMVNNQPIDSYLFSDISFYGNYSLYDYNTYDSSVSDYMKAKTELLSNLLHAFGVSIGADYKPNGATGAWPLDAMNYLDYLDHARYGAIDYLPCPMGGFSTYPIITMLNAGKPIMVSGYRAVTPTTTSGHTWIIDGYMKQHRIGLDDDIYTRHIVHFNWGWHGLYDGYYYNSSISNRVCTDVSYDPNTTPVPSSSYNYNLDTYCLIY